MTSGCRPRTQAALTKLMLSLGMWGWQGDMPWPRPLPTTSPWDGVGCTSSQRLVLLGLLLGTVPAGVGLQRGTEPCVGLITAGRGQVTVLMCRDLSQGPELCAALAGMDRHSCAVPGKLREGRGGTERPPSANDMEQADRVPPPGVPVVIPETVLCRERAALLRVRWEQLGDLGPGEEAGMGPGSNLQGRTALQPLHKCVLRPHSVAKAELHEAGLWSLLISGR